jgi:tetratricopeptide (TPR) repeat protein
MNANGDAAGFLRAGKARHAQEILGHSEGLVTVLRLSQADLKPAEEALRVAKELFETHDYSKAISQAKRAEAIAIALDERFNNYTLAWKALQIRVQELKRLGLHTENLEAVVGAAEAKVVGGTWESGILIPNYMEGKAMLERAASEGRDLLVRANQASNRIFLAELAIEALAELQAGHSSTVAETLERAIEEATRELALGNVDAATRIATELEGRAEKMRSDLVGAQKILDTTEASLRELRGEGIVTERIEKQIAYARDMLAKGLIEPASAMSRRLVEEAASLGEDHAKAATSLSDAEVLYLRLQREGFQSYEADAALRDARRSLRQSNYAAVKDFVDRAQEAFARRRNAREALAKSISDTRKRIAILSDRQVPLLSDIQEVLGRAEREFSEGNFSGSSEDLQLATVLLSQATHPGLAFPAKT